MEQFQKRMLRLKRILEGTDPGALRDQLLTDELVKARKLLRRESSIFNVMEKAHKGSPKGEVILVQYESVVDEFTAMEFSF